MPRIRAIRPDASSSLASVDAAESNGIQRHEEQAHACACYHTWPNEAPCIDEEREARHYDGANR